MRSAGNVFMRVESRLCGNFKKPLGRFRRRGLVSQGSFPLALGCRTAKWKGSPKGTF